MLLRTNCRVVVVVLLLLPTSNVSGDMLSERSGSPELLDDPFSMRECTALEQRIYGSMNRALRSRKVVPLGRSRRSVARHSQAHGALTGCCPPCRTARTTLALSATPVR